MITILELLESVHRSRLSVLKFVYITLLYQANSSLSSLGVLFNMILSHRC